MAVIIEVALFAVAQVGGIAVGRRALEMFARESLVSPPAVNVSVLLVSFAVATLLFFVLAKTRRKAGGTIAHVVYIGALFLGLQAAIAVVAGETAGVFVAVVALIAQAKTRTVFGHNALFLVAAAGIGGVLGATIVVRDAMILLALLSVYDVIAVYGTRHMVTMAEGMLRSGAVFGIVLPSKTAGWIASMKPVVQEKLRSNTQKYPAYFLGGGDVALPMVLVVSALKQSASAPWILLGFAVGGFLVMRLLFSRIGHRRPMPALPPIAGFTLLGVLFL